MTTSTGLDTIRGNAFIAQLIGESEPVSHAPFLGRWLRASPFSETRKSEAELMDRVSLMKAAVLDFEPALELLTELSSKGALVAAELETRLSTRLVLAVGMLAGAQLCDIDNRAVRINAAGMDFVEGFASDFSNSSV
jgi:hypothetical protein